MVTQVTFLRKLLVAGMERGLQQVALYATEELLGFCWTDQVLASEVVRNTGGKDFMWFKE